MLRFGTQAFCIMMAALSLGIATSTAQAYLDPGTGSMILQVLLGGVAGVALAGKLYWQKLLSLLGIRRQSEIDAAEWVGTERDMGGDVRSKD